MNKIDFNKYSPFHKTGHTSKGDQRKWKHYIRNIARKIYLKKILRVH